MKRKILFVIAFYLAYAFSLSACSLSLAQDITPPPGYQPPVFQETVGPVGESSGVESTPEPSVDVEEVGEGQAASTQEVAGENIGDVPASGGVVFGAVENGSGTGLPEDLEVTLFGYNHFEEVVKLTTQAEENGRFEYKGVDLIEDFIFFTLVEYQDTNYSSEFHVAGPDETEVDLSMVIYDTTTDPSNLVVDRLHVFFTYPAADIVQVIHSLSISNLGNKTIIPLGETEAIIEFILPEGAANLAFEQGEIGQPYISTVNGFGDTTPILPDTGGYQLTYAYELPFERQMEWVQPITLPTEVIVFFAPEDGLQVESGQLTASDFQSLDDVVYQVFVSGEMAIGDEFQVEISGRNPSAGLSLILNTDTTGLLVGAIGLVLVVVGVWWWFRIDGDSSRLSDRPVSPESVMDEIIALDDAYEAGQMEEAAYQAKRSQLKARLRELVE